MIVTGNNRTVRQKPVTVPFLPPQIPHKTNWDRTRSLRGERLATNGLNHGAGLSGQMVVCHVAGTLCKYVRQIMSEHYISLFCVVY